MDQQSRVMWHLRKGKGRAEAYLAAGSLQPGKLVYVLARPVSLHYSNRLAARALVAATRSYSPKHT